jgi:hypothetical protein
MRTSILAFLGLLTFGARADAQFVLGGLNWPKTEEIQSLLESKPQFPVQYIPLFIRAMDDFKAEWNDDPNNPPASLKQRVLEFGRAAFSANCEGAMSVLVKAGYDYIPTVKGFLDRWPRFSTCGVEFAKGFLCDIPNSARDLVSLGWEAVKAGWRNRRTCLGVSLLSGLFAVASPTAPLAAGIVAGAFGVCGLAHFFKETWDKMKSCWNRLSKEKMFSLFLKVGLKNSCNLMGQFVFDIVLDVVTGGGALGVTLPAGAKRLGETIKKVSDAVAAEAWMKFSKESQTTAAGMIKDTVTAFAREFAECAP